MKEFLGPVRIDFYIVINKQQVVVLRAGDRKIPLLRTVLFLMVKVSDIQSCYGPARILRHGFSA